MELKEIIMLAPIFVLLIVLIALGICAMKAFLGMPKDKQLAKVSEWLLYWVVEAEKEFGSGTGQIKLRYVYDQFVTSFPDLASLISFEAFSMLVDQALERMREMLKTNKDLRKYVDKEKKETAEELSNMQRAINTMKELGKAEQELDAAE